MGQVTFYTYKGMETEMNDFFDAYQLISIVIPPDKAIRGIKPRKDRVCRYCKRGADTTTFKKEAHTISRLLGNRYLINDFECDECNEIFGKYESNLANMLGISRTVFGKEELGKIPTYVSKGNSLRAASLDLSTDKRGILLSDHDGTNIEYDHQTGKTVVSYLKNEFTPILVYKALLKIALGLISPIEVEKYSYAFNFLAREKPPVENLSICKIHYSELQRNTKVHAYIFKKRDSSARLPSHIVKLYYENIIFQFFIPFYADDIKVIYNGKEFTPKWCPPILLSPQSSTEICRRSIKDLSGMEKITEKGFLSFEFDKDSAGNLSAYDLKTNTTKFPGEESARNISKILFVSDDLVFEPKVLANFFQNKDIKKR